MCVTFTKWTESNIDIHLRKIIQIVQTFNGFYNRDKESIELLVDIASHFSRFIHIVVHSLNEKWNENKWKEREEKCLLSHNDELIIRLTWSTLCYIWKKLYTYANERFRFRKPRKNDVKYVNSNSFTSKIELKKLINGTIRLFDLYFRFYFCLFFYRFSHRFIIHQGLDLVLKVLVLYPTSIVHFYQDGIDRKSDAHVRIEQTSKSYCASIVITG